MNRVISRNLCRTILANNRLPIHTINKTNLIYSSSKVARAQALTNHKQNNQKEEEKQLVFNDKRQTIQYFQNLTDKIYTNLTNQLNWQVDANFFKTFKLLENNKNLVRFLNDIKQTKTLSRFSIFVETNLDLYAPNEKSAIFKFCCLIKNSDSPLSYRNLELDSLVSKLEIDFYKNVKNYNQIDMNNYYDGLSMIRSNNNHFISEALNPLFIKLLDIASIHQDIDAKNVKPRFAQNKSHLIAYSEPPANKVLPQNQEIIDSINRKWLGSFFFDDNLLLSLHLMNKFHDYFINNNKNYFYSFLVKNNYELLIKQSSIETKAFILSTYKSNINKLRLKQRFNEIYVKLFSDNVSSIIEQWDKIKLLDNRIELIKWYKSYLSSSNNDYSSLIKYKMPLANFIANQIKSTRSPIEFAVNLECLTILCDNKFDENSLTIASYLLDIFNPVYENLSSDGLFKNMASGEASDRSYQDRQVDKIFTKKTREVVLDKFMKLENNFELDSLEHLLSLIQLGQFRDGQMRTIELFNDQFLRKLENSSQACIDKYIQLAAETFNKLPNLKLDTSVLSFIHKQLFVKNSVLKYDSTLSNALAICLTDESFVVKNLDSMFPVMNKLSSIDARLTGPILREIRRNKLFFFSEFPTHMKMLMNKYYQDLIVQFCDVNNVTFDLYYFKIITDLAAIKDQVTYEYAPMISIKPLLKSFEGYLEHFEKLNFKNDYASAIEYEMELFEKNIFSYCDKVRKISKLALLSDYYNHEFLKDTLSFVNKVIYLFKDNLFREIQLKKNKTKNYFSESNAIDLITCYGLFNYFDYKPLIGNKSENNKEDDEFMKNFDKLDRLNTELYPSFRNFIIGNPASLVWYNLCLLNMNMMNKKAINDMFNGIRDIDQIYSKNYANKNKTKLILKMAYFINQELCIKYNDSNPIWLFDKLKPSLLREDQNLIEPIVQATFGESSIITRPIYKYNLISDFEVAIEKPDKENPEGKKTIRIPIFLYGNDCLYENLNEFKRPMAAYIENFRRLYPVVTINSSKLGILSQENQIKYIKEK